MEALYYESPLYEAFDELLMLYNTGSCNNMKYFIEAGNNTQDGLITKIINTLKEIWKALKEKVKSLFGKVDEDAYIEVNSNTMKELDKLKDVNNELHLLNKEITKGDEKAAKQRTLKILGIVTGVTTAVGAAGVTTIKMKASELDSVSNRLEDMYSNVDSALDNLQMKFKDKGAVSFIAEKLRMTASKLEKVLVSMVKKIENTPNKNTEKNAAKAKTQEYINKETKNLRNAGVVKESFEELDNLFMYNLYQANQIMESYVEFDEIEFLFEAESEQVKNDLIQKNKDTVNSSKGTFMKAIDALIAMINNVINSIGDFIRKTTMSKAERDAFEQFKAACANDPKLKGKTVLVKDWKKIQAEYNRVMTRAENELKRSMKGEQADIDGAIKDLEKYMGGVLKGAGTAVGMNFALNAASTSSEIAQGIYSKLKDDKEVMKNLRKEVGFWNAEKFKREMKTLSSENLLRRKMYAARHATCNSIEEAFQQTVGDCLSIYNTVTAEPERKFKLVGDKIITVSNNDYNDENKPELTKGAKKILKTAVGNKQIRQAMPSVGDIAKGTANTGKILANEKITDMQMKKREKDREKAEKAGLNYHQSALDAITGKNAKKDKD